MVRQPFQLTALALSGSGGLLLDLPEALGVPVAEGRQLRVLGRQARRAVRRPADERGVVDLHGPPSAHESQPIPAACPGNKSGPRSEILAYIGPLRVVVLDLALE